MEISPVEISNYRIRRAKEDLATAKENCENKRLNQSLNRSYYAIFHAARALLAFDNFDSKKHSGVIRYFNKLYIASGKIEKSYSVIIGTAFNARLQSDYHDFYIVSKREAEEQIQNAEIFINMIEDYIKRITE